MSRPLKASAWPHRRLAETFAVIGRRLRSSPRSGAEPVWPAGMDRLVLIGLLAVMAASFFDGMALEAVRSSQSPTLEAMRFVTDIGKSQWYLVPAAIVFLFVGLVDWRRAGAGGKVRLAMLTGHAGFIFAAVALSGIFVNIAKLMIGRARPALFDEFGPYHFDPFTPGYLYASFPSGHSTTMGAVTAILMIWSPRYSALFFVTGLFFAATRIAAKAHYASDVVAGFLVGIGATILLARFLASRGMVFRFLPGKMMPAVARRASRK